MNYADYGTRLEIADLLIDRLERLILAVRAAAAVVPSGDELERRRRSAVAAQRLTEAREALRRAYNECGSDEGPLINIPGWTYKEPAFREFVRGWQRAGETVLEIQEARGRWGTNIGWGSYLRSMQRIHIAMRWLAEFRATAESHLTGVSFRSAVTQLANRRDEQMLSDAGRADELIRRALDELKSRADREQEKWIEKLLDEITGDARPYPKPKDQQRDQSIYEKLMGGMTRRKVMEDVNSEIETHGGCEIDDVDTITSAAHRYADWARMPRWKGKTGPRKNTESEIGV